MRQPERLDDAFDPEVETIVVVAYGQLVPKKLLERARWLNVHPSLLPRWRGAAPVERALIAGDEETGVSIIELVEELDAGPIAAQQRFAVGIDDDAGAIFARAAEWWGSHGRLTEPPPEVQLSKGGRTDGDGCRFCSLVKSRRMES